MDFASLAQQCAPHVHSSTLAAVASAESAFNPYAIGVVGGQLHRQPSNKEEALATAHALEGAGWNFSVGIAQVNRHNLARNGLDYEAAFDPCRNLQAGARILTDCFIRASARNSDPQAALQAALSCYYSGNFTRGFQPEGGPSYVQRVLTHAARQTAPSTRAKASTRGRQQTEPLAHLTGKGS